MGQGQWKRRPLWWGSKACDVRDGHDQALYTILLSKCVLVERSVCDRDYLGGIWRWGRRETNHSCEVQRLTPTLSSLLSHSSNSNTQRTELTAASKHLEPWSHIISLAIESKQQPSWFKCYACTPLCKIICQASRSKHWLCNCYHKCSSLFSIILCIFFISLYCYSSKKII